MKKNRVRSPGRTPNADRGAAGQIMNRKARRRALSGRSDTQTCSYSELLQAEHRLGFRSGGL